ncbi:UV-damage endonuclease [Chlorella vulgaris]
MSFLRGCWVRPSIVSQFTRYCAANSTPAPHVVSIARVFRAAMGRARSKSNAAAAAVSGWPATPTAAAVPPTIASLASGRKRRGREAPPAEQLLSASVPEAATAEAEDVVPAASLLIEEAEAEPEPAEATAVRRRTRRRRAAEPVATDGTPMSPAAADTLRDEQVEVGVEVEEEEAPKPKKKGGGRRRQPDPPPLTDMPTAEYVARLQAEGYTPPPLPVPNLGYACLNTTLRDLRPSIFTSRDCIKRTMDAKGLPHLGSLALQNCQDLPLMIQWNAEHGIRFFRMSSVIFPWIGTYDAKELPQYEEIAAALRLAGDLARLHGQRITFHPSHFVKLAATDAELASKSIRELEGHSQILDLMGYEPSPVNKINIHVGGIYSSTGSKEDTMRRWAESFQRLSPSCRARMTIENDDVASAFSLEDLLFLHELTKCPLVFDFHHHRFCPGSLSEKEALEAAMKTWPAGIRPVVHWSESQEGRKPFAHSDYVRGPINLHGHEDKVDELALMAYRGDIQFPADVGTMEEAPIGQEAEVALKFV